MSTDSGAVLLYMSEQIQIKSKFVQSYTEDENNSWARNFSKPVFIKSFRCLFTLSLLINIYVNAAVFLWGTFYFPTSIPLTDHIFKV